MKKFANKLFGFLAICCLVAVISIIWGAGDMGVRILASCVTIMVFLNLFRL